MYQEQFICLILDQWSQWVACSALDMTSLKFVSERDLGYLPAFQPVFLATPGPTALALELMIMSTAVLQIVSSLIFTFACT